MATHVCMYVVFVCKFFQYLPIYGHIAWFHCLVIVKTDTIKMDMPVTLRLDIDPFGCMLRAVKPGDRKFYFAFGEAFTIS